MSVFPLCLSPYVFSPFLLFLPAVDWSPFCRRLDCQQPQFSKDHFYLPESMDISQATILIDFSWSGAHHLVQSLLLGEWMFCDWPGLIHILTLKVGSRNYNQIKENRKPCWKDQRKQTNWSIKTITTKYHYAGHPLIQLLGLISES